jgi:hypothetical protein
MDQNDDRNDNGISSNDEIEQLMLCEVIAKCIIDNYQQTGLYVCTYCDQEIRGTTEVNLLTPTTEDILYHVYDHYRYDGFNGLGGLYICNACHREFYSVGLLNQHQHQDHPAEMINENNNDNNDDPNVDNNDNNNNNDDDSDIDDERVDDERDEDDSDASDNSDDSDEEGEGHIYDCPICHRPFALAIELGNHFMNTHNNYNQLSALDENKSAGFPGFDVLVKIEMIRYVKSGEKIEENTCVICCDKYDSFMGNKTDIDLVSDNGKNRLFCDDTKMLYSKKSEEESKYPLELKCCKAIMCSQCLKKHIISKSGEPECPFCRKNHTRYDKKYIVYDERPKEKRLSHPFKNSTKIRL